jgi:hypothetical protein
MMCCPLAETLKDPQSLPHSGVFLFKKSAHRKTLAIFELSRKKLYEETGFYYYGARYLNPKTSVWISADPAVGEYVPRAPVNDEAKKRNGNLPGRGGVFNYVNFHVYHYAGNNPVKYTDPDGRDDEIPDFSKERKILYEATRFIEQNAETDDEKLVAEKLTKMLDSKKVQFDDVQLRGRPKNTLGFHDRQRGIIVIDIDSIQKLDEGSQMILMVEILVHEGFHAVQFSRGETGNWAKTLSKVVDIETPAYNIGLKMANKYRLQNGIRITRSDWTKEEVRNLIKRNLNLK